MPRSATLPRSAARLAIPWTLTALTVAALVLALLPVLVTRYLPILDLPSHEARIAVLHNLKISGLGSPFYGFDTWLLPNIAFDAIGLGLSVWMTPDMVGRVFVAATLLLTFTGVVALSRVAIGRWSLAPLAAALLLFNLVTAMGFLSYSMGIALMFWALAARIQLQRAPPPLRALAGCAFGLVLMLCHLGAFAVYALMLAGLGIDQLIRRRRSLLQVVGMGLETVPALALFALMSTGGQGHMSYDQPFAKAKLLAVLRSVSSESIPADIAFLLGGLAVVALLLVCGRLRLSRPLAPGLVLLVVAYVAVPANISEGNHVDSRMVFVILMLAVAAVDFRLLAARRALAAGLLLVAAGAYAAKQVALAAAWHGEGRAIADIAEAFTALPDGAVVLQTECWPLPGDFRGAYANHQPPLTHVAAIAGFGGARFPAVSWTVKGQQPIVTLPAYQPYKAFQAQIGHQVCTPDQYRAVLSGAQALAVAQGAAGAPLFLMLLRPPSAGLLSPAAPLVAHTSEMQLYRVPLQAAGPSIP